MEKSVVEGSASIPNIGKIKQWFLYGMQKRNGDDINVGIGAVLSQVRLSIFTPRGILAPVGNNIVAGGRIKTSKCTSRKGKDGESGS